MTLFRYKIGCRHECRGRWRVVCTKGESNRAKFSGAKAWQSHFCCPTKRGRVSFKCGFFHYLSLSLRLFIRSRLTIMWSGKIWCVLYFVPSTCYFLIKLYGNLDNWNVSRTMTWNAPVWWYLCHIGFSFINECISFRGNHSQLEYEPQNIKIKGTIGDGIQYPPEGAKSPSEGQHFQN